MDTAEFLSHVVAPGNYIAVCHRKAGTKVMGTRFFPRSDVVDAAGFMLWCAKHSRDVWYCPASYLMASPRDKPGQYTGERKQSNVQAVKCFWYDADVKPGAHTSQADVVTWLKVLRDKTGIGLPSLVVNSGYGLHIYWLLDDALAPDAWLPRARAFRELLRTGGAVGDLSLSIDSSRLLRPPGTKNFKVPETPVSTSVL